MATFLTYPIVQLNPYKLIGTQFTAGLDAVVAADADVESIVQAVYDYVQPIYYPFPASEATVENELKGVMYKALNGFGNQLVRQAAWMGGSTAKANVFNNRQQVFIELMLNGLQAVPVKSIASYLSDLEDHITSSRLSLQEQAPLLMATMTGRRSFAYWMEKVVTPGDWSDYFNANAAINYANIRFWVSSSIQGALLAATRNRNNDKSQNVSIDPAHALAAGLSVSAGRVMLNYIERIQNASIWLVNWHLFAIRKNVYGQQKPVIDIGRHDEPEVCAEAYDSCKKACAVAAGALGGEIAGATLGWGLIAGIAIAFAAASWCIDQCYCEYCKGTKRDKFCEPGGKKRVGQGWSVAGNSINNLHR
jgi:hypothetical protein